MNDQEMRQNDLQTDSFPSNDNIWKHVKSSLVNKYTYVFECFENDEFVKKRRGKVVTNPLTDELEKRYIAGNPDAQIRLNECDSNYEIERRMIKKEATLNFDIYKEDLTRVVMSRLKQDNSADLDNYLNNMKKFFDLSGEIFEKGKEIKELDEFINIMELEEREIAGHLQRVRDERDDMKEKVEKSLSNIYIQMRFTKSYVEISLNKVVDLLKDAILINVDIINNKNRRILDLGRKKIDKLKHNLDYKNIVEDLRYEVMTKDLDIEDLIIESMAITRLKVTKQLQAALAKNETHMSETEEKNLINQKKELKIATKKRIGIFKAKEKAMKKDIEQLIHENRQLNLKGAKL